MKTITKRFLKASVAMLLVVIMLFGTTISGFAAVVDNAETKANKTFVSGEYVYLKNYKPSGWDNPWIQSSGYYWIHLYNSSNDDYCDAKFSLYSGTANTVDAIYRAKIETAGTYNKVIFTRCGSSASPWTYEYNRSGEITLDGNSNCFTGWSVGGTDETQSRYAVSPASATLALTDPSQVLDGSGTSADPYTVAPGANFNLTITATKADPGMDGYALSIGQNATKETTNTTGTYTETQTAPATANTTFNITGYAWNYESDKYSSAKASNILYFKTIEIKYEVTVTAGENGYVSAGGLATKTDGIEVTATPDTANGYVFAGWSVVDGKGSGTFDDPFDATTTFYPDEDSEIKATFALKEFTAKFFDINGDQIGEDQKVTYNNAPTPPTAPDVEGKRFTDWNPVVGPLTDMNNETGIVNYYAQYEDLTYTVTFVDYDNTPIGEPQTVVWGKDATAPTDIPTPEGYRFTGWDTEFTNIKADTIVTATYVKTHNVEITAPVGASISYSYDNYDGQEVTGTVNASEKATLTVDDDTEITFTKTLDAPKYITGMWEVGDDKSADDTYKLEVLQNTTVTYNPTETFAVTVNEETDNGTVKIGDTAYTAPVRVVSGETVTLTVTPNENYSATVKIGDQVLTPDADGKYSITVNGDKTITVTYTDVSCKIAFDGVESEELVVGGTCTYKASATDDYCTHDITYSSSDNTIATVNATTGEVTALTPGTVTITASCTNPEGEAKQAKAQYTVVVLNPNVKVKTVTLNVNETQIASVSEIENEPDCEYQLKYSVNTGAGYSNNYTITEDGAVTGQKPGSVLATVSLCCGETIIGSYSFSVKVNAPSISLAPENIKMYPGHTFDGLGVSASVAPVSITWVPSDKNVEVISTTETPSVASVTTDAVTEAVESGVVVKVYYNEYYTYEATVNVDIVLPILNVGNKTAIDLENGGDKSTDVFTVNVDDDDIVGKCTDCDSPITVDTEDHDVATAEIDNGTVTVTAVGVGTTTLTLSYHGVTKEIPITVTQFADYVTMYLVTSDSDIGGLHMWISTVGDIIDNQSMVHIGYADSAKTQYVYAYKFPRSILSSNASFKFYDNNGTTWQNQSAETTLSKDCESQMWYQYTSNNGALTVLNKELTLPSIRISTENVTVRVNEEATITATTTGSSVEWKSANTSLATVSGDTTGTIKGVKVGFTEVTARAFTQCGSGYALYSLNKTEAAYEYIASSATAQVQVKRAADNQDVTIYLSSGSLGFGNLNPSSSITWSGSSEGTSTTKDLEKIVPYTNTTFQNATVYSTISNSDYCVNAFVIYNIESRSFTSVLAEKSGVDKDKGTVTYKADISAPQENCYIYPVFFHTDEYLANGTEDTSDDMEFIEIYVDKAETDFDIWGPLVSCYAYGSNNDSKTEYFGEWPGQLMIPDEDGNSWWTQIAVDKNNNTTYEGVLFNNYVFSADVGTTAVHSLYEELGITNQRNIQTYDYRESTTLFEQGFDAITYEIKQNLDGYHNPSDDKADDTNDNSAFQYDLTSINPLEKGFEFQYLRKYNQRDKLISMNSNENTEERVSSSPAADFYVVAMGDYDYNSGDYTGDSTYWGHWSVEWYVYDSTGKYTGVHKLSDAFYKQVSDTNTTTLLAQALIDTDNYTAEDLENTVVMVSYEAGNDCPDFSGHSTQYSYDGQWYGIKSTDTYDINTVGVICSDEDGDVWTTVDSTDPIYEGPYGGAYFVDEVTGENKGIGYVTVGKGYVELNAIPNDGYVFVKWCTITSSGKVNDIATTSYVDEVIVNGPRTFYAVFRELGEADVVISHTKYVNLYDDEGINTNIPDHKGDALMYVSVSDADGNLMKEAGPSINGGNVSFPAEEGIEYTVTIKTLPLGADWFFAWYTDSVDVNGEATYEEIMTRGDDVGKNEEACNGEFIETTFTYVYKPAIDNKRVNIYTDCKQVAGTATLEYTYTNRYGALRTITKTVDLTDDEILSFDGNGNVEYQPEYLDYWYKESDKSDKIFTAPSDASEYDTGNRITEDAPRHQVTEAVHQEIRWALDLDENNESDKFTVKPSYARLYATQTPIQYQVNYTGAYVDGVETSGSTGLQDYNTLIAGDLAIATDALNPDGVAFSYWQDTYTGEIISYNLNYAYRIVENRNIKAVYGADDYDPWSAAVENVTQTREYANKDKIIDIVYVDFLLSFQNEEQKLLRDLTDVEYGLVLVREDGVAVTEDENGIIIEPDYPSTTASSFIDEKVRKIVDNKITAAKFRENTSSDKYYYANNYILTGSQNITNLNRLNFILDFNNDGTDYHKYAFSTYAYVIATDRNGNPKTYISEVENLNIYKTATEDVEQ